MSARPHAIGSLLLLLACLDLLQIQTASAQTLVAFDENETVFFIDGSFERRHGFLGVQNLHEARILKAKDSSMILAITLRDSAGFQISERPLSSEDLQFLRQRHTMVMQGSLAHDAPVAQREPDGATSFVRSFAGLGFSWYGLTPAVAIMGGEVGSFPAFMGIYLVSAGASYFYADWYASNRQISNVQSTAFQYFATRGVAHGFALTGLILGEQTDVRIGVITGTVVSLAEGFYAMGLVERSDWSAETVSALSLYGDAGHLLGIGAGYLLDPDSPPILEDIEKHTRRYSAAFLLGGAAGLLVGSVTTRSIQYAPGDAAAHETAAYLGATLGFTISDAGEGRSRNDQVLGASIGLIGGHLLGGYIAESRELDEESGNRVRLLTSGGVLVGLGMAFAASSGGGDQTLYLGLAVAGGAAGFAYGLYRAREAMADVLGEPLELRLHPEGILMPLVRDRRAPALIAHHPVLTLTISF